MIKQSASRMKKFVLFAMIFIGLALYFNSQTGITGFATIENKGIDYILAVDVKELKYDIITSETKRPVFYLRNLLDEQIEVEVGISGKASNFVSIDTKKFYIPARGVQAIELRIYAPLEAIPQLYFGEIVVSSSAKGKLVPLQLNLKKRIQDAVDVKVRTQKSMVKPGEELEIIIDATNLAREAADVQANVRITKDGKEIYTVTDFLRVEGAASKSFLTFIPKDAEDGTYLIEMKANAKLEQQFAIFEDKKELIVATPQETEKPTQTSNELWWWLISGVMLAAVIITTSALVKSEVISMKQILDFLGHRKSEKKGKQYLKEGFSYIIDEKGTRTSYETLRMLQKEGYAVFCITRLNPKLLVEEIPEFRTVEIHWLTTQEAEKTLGPTDIEGIYNVVDKFITDNPKSAVMLDGLSFLSINVSFAQVMLLLQYIKDRISTSKSILIAPLNTSTMNKKENEQIAEEMDILDSQNEILPEIYSTEKAENGMLTDTEKYSGAGQIETVDDEKEPPAKEQNEIGGIERKGTVEIDLSKRNVFTKQEPDEEIARARDMQKPASGEPQSKVQPKKATTKAAIKPTRELLDYMKKKIDAGFDEVKLMALLQVKGWQRETLDKAIETIKAEAKAEKESNERKAKEKQAESSQDMAYSKRIVENEIAQAKPSTDAWNGDDKLKTEDLQITKASELGRQNIREVPVFIADADKVPMKLEQAIPKKDEYEKDDSIIIIPAKKEPKSRQIIEEKKPAKLQKAPDAVPPLNIEKIARAELKAADSLANVVIASEIKARANVPAENDDSIIEKSLDELKAELDALRKKVKDGQIPGRLMPKFEMDLTFLYNEFSIARITYDDKDVKKVKTKLEELKKQLN